jgi:xylan 1,4-beta-xylosidase
VSITGLPKGASRVRLTHYRIDDGHSNAYTAWKAMGSPQNPTPTQYAELKSKDGLELLESPRWMDVKNGAVTVSTEMPHHSISLLQLDW